MTTKTVPYSESLTFGWETFKNNAFFLIGVVVAISLIEGAVEFASERAPESSYEGFVLDVIAALVAVILELGFLVILLKFKDGLEPEFSDLFNRLPLIFSYVAATFLYLTMVIFGLVFLIFPGIYFAVRFYFYGFIIVDEEVGPIDALKKAADLSEGVRMEIFLFGLILVGINILGLVAMFVGIFVTVPVTALAVTHMYRHLAGGGPGREIPADPS